MEDNKEFTKKIFEGWVNQFSDELFSWAFFKTSSKELAEDLVQDTFLAAFHKIETFEGKSQPKTWLFSILNNKIIDYYRSSARTTKKNRSLSEVTGTKLYAEIFNKYGCWKSDEIKGFWEHDQELLDNPEFNTVLQECMNNLPQKWNLALTAKYLSPKKTENICQELEITASNYWQIVHRAKLLLKKCLDLNWA